MTDEFSYQDVILLSKPMFVICGLIILLIHDDVVINHFLSQYVTKYSMHNRGFFVNLDNNLWLFGVSDKLEWAVNNESMDFWKEEIWANSSNISKNK